MYGGAGGLVNNKLLICGGKNSEHDAIDKCFVLGQNNTIGMKYGRKYPPGQTRDNEAVDGFQGSNRFRQEFPILQFCRQKLWVFPLQQVDHGDEEEESSDGDEDDVDDNVSGQREKEDESREDEEHAK